MISPLPQNEKSCPARRDGGKPFAPSEATAINYPVTVDAKKLRALILTGDAIIRAADEERVALWTEIRKIICAQMQMPPNDKAQPRESSPVG